MSSIDCTYIRESATRADGVIVAHPVLVVWILSPGQNILVAIVVWFLIQHPAATLHLNGVAAVEVGVHVSAVGFTLMGAALEISVLVENDLNAGGKFKRKQAGVKSRKSLCCDCLSLFYFTMHAAHCLIFVRAVKPQLNDFTTRV